MVKEFSLDYTNIRGLRSNHLSVYAHLSKNKPAVFALSETKVNSDADINQFQIAGYRLVPLFSPQRGIAVYVRNDVPFSVLSEHSSTNPEFNYVWIRFKLCKHIMYFCFLHRSPNMSDVNTACSFQKLSDIIDEFLLTSPSSEIILAGDFNVHNVQWLRHSSTTSPSGRCVELFSESFNLEQLVDCPTRVPDVVGHSASLLDLFLTSHPEKYSISVTSPLGNSDHCLVSARFTTSSLTTSNLTSNKRLVWHYKRADWAGLNKFFREIDWTECFATRNAEYCSEVISNIIWFGMHVFIPRSLVNVKPNNNSWFNEDCRRALRVKESAFQEYKTNKTPEMRRIYKEARNTSKYIIH